MQEIVEDWVPPVEVARTLGVAVGTLGAWRNRGRGPAYYKVGGSIRYRVSDVEAYVEACRREAAAS